MQDIWERRHNFIPLDIKTITQLLQPVFPGQNVVSAEPLGGGLINTNYKINISGLTETFVLRLYVRDRAACQKEVDIFRLVHERVPVPEVLYADTGGVRYELPYTVTRWIDGVMLKEVLAKGSSEDISEAAFAVGKVLANIGSYMFERAGFFGHGLVVEQPMIDAGGYIEMCLQGRAGERLGDGMAQRLRELVSNNAPLLAKEQRVFSLVHTDFQASNILVRRVRQEKWGTDAWKITAVLDWEWAHSGTSLFDMGILLRHDRQLPPMFEPQFINGYVQQGGRLPVAWKKMAKLLDLVNLCEFLNSPAQRGTLVDDAKGIVIETVEHWDSYDRTTPTLPPKANA